MNWQLWRQCRVEREAKGIRPLLASWEKKSHPAQSRLCAYLDEFVAALSPLPEAPCLYLHMDIDVERDQRLLRDYDLENYLTPLFGRSLLHPGRFVLVSARKFVGGGSRVLCGTAERSVQPDERIWDHITLDAGSGTSFPAWKEGVRRSLISSEIVAMPPGPVAVRLAWECSASRNWTQLWKPTGDAMGPVLGERNMANPFNPDDDRIVDLEFHLNVDNSLRHDVVVGMWWRHASAVLPSTVSTRS